MEKQVLERKVQVEKLVLMEKQLVFHHGGADGG
jgi:hypothetical protein